MNNILPVDTDFKQLLNKEAFYKQSYDVSKGKSVFGVKKRYFIYPKDGQLPSTSNVNQPVTFYIHKRGNLDFLSRLRLVTEVKFTVADDATSGKEQYLKAMPIFQFRKIEIYNNNNLLISLNPDELYQDIYMHTNEDDWKYVSSHYGLGDATSRTVENNDVKKFYLNFDDILSMFSNPFPIYKLSDNCPLEFRIYFNDQILTEEPDKTTYVYQKTYMLATYITPHTRQIAIENINKLTKFMEVLPSSITITPLTTTTNQSHILSYLRNRYVALITFAYITDSNYNAGKRTVFATINEFALTNSGQNIDNNSNFKMTDEMFKDVILYDSNIENKDQLRNDNLYFISYVNDLTKTFSENDTLFDGAKLFYEAQPQLDLVFASNPSASRILFTAWEMTQFTLMNGVIVKN